MTQFPDHPSFAEQLEQVQQFDEAAIEKLWMQYYPYLIKLADQKLAQMGVPQRAFDGEDVAASALASFFRALQKDRFSELKDEDGLFALLKTMTFRKVIDRMRQASALKAGGGKVRGESAFGDSAGSSPSFGIANIPGDAPSPEWIALMEEECNELFVRLEDDKLRTIVRLKLEGYSNQEIATLSKCSIATIERRLNLIRSIWTAKRSSS